MSVGDPQVADAITHLRASDPTLRELIDGLGGADAIADRSRGRPEDHYGTIVRSIVGQQLSTKAAAAIWGRLIDRYDGRPPNPDEVLAEDPEELRAAAGLSRAKVVFLRSLAEHVLDGSLELDQLDGMDDDAVIAELTAVKGIGVWSAHMFLMFHLRRPDVLAVGDLGVRKAVMRAYGLEAMPDPATMERIAEPWRPYRTIACLFLWESLSATPV